MIAHRPTVQYNIYVHSRFICYYLHLCDRYRDRKLQTCWPLLVRQSVCDSGRVCNFLHAARIRLRCKFVYDIFVVCDIRNTMCVFIICAGACMHVYACAHIRVYMSVCMCMCVCMCLCVYASVHARICMCVILSIT